MVKTLTIGSTSALLIAVVAIIGSLGCPEPVEPIQCGPYGCADAGDGDGDSDGDGDGDGDSDADADIEPTPDCGEGDRCLLALTFRICCPCPTAMLQSVIDGDLCILSIEGEPERPEGCVEWSCDDVECEDCPEPSGAACEAGACVTTFPGDCETRDDCDDGEICEVDEGSSSCVPDPNECSDDEPCPEGLECRDWLGMGYSFCSAVDSCHGNHNACDYNEFCEDSDGDGVTECVDHAPACRLGHDAGDCPEDQVCQDPDGDGYGECVED